MTPPYPALAASVLAEYTHGLRLLTSQAIMAQRRAEALGPALLPSHAATLRRFAVLLDSLSRDAERDP